MNTFLLCVFLGLSASLQALAGLVPRDDSPARMAALRERALSRLPRVVAEELRQRDPSTYDLPLDDLIAEERGLTKRQSSNYFSKCVDGKFASTYDDGVYKWHQNISSYWDANGHKISYMINLKNFDCSFDSPYAEMVQASVDAGMTIVSHTSHHLDLTTLTDAQIDQEIEQIENFTWKVLGLVPGTFRPPYMSTNDRINQYLKTRWGLDIVGVSLDSNDWQTVDTDPDKVIANVQKAAAGDIVLSHETHENSVTKVMPAFVDHLKGAGIKSVGIAECLGRSSAYKVFDKTKRQQRDATWVCPS